MTQVKVYPSHRYHPTEGTKLIHSESDDLALGPEWVHSPAEYGHETCPGRTPDPVIAAKGEEYRKRIEALKPSALKAPEARKPGRPKKLDPKEGVSA